MLALNGLRLDVRAADTGCPFSLVTTGTKIILSGFLHLTGPAAEQKEQFDELRAVLLFTIAIHASNPNKIVELLTGAPYNLTTRPATPLQELSCRGQTAPLLPEDEQPPGVSADYGNPVPTGSDTSIVSVEVVLKIRTVNPVTTCP